MLQRKETWNSNNSKYQWNVKVRVPLHVEREFEFIGKILCV